MNNNKYLNKSKVKIYKNLNQGIIFLLRFELKISNFEPNITRNRTGRFEFGSTHEEP